MLQYNGTILGNSRGDTYCFCGIEGYKFTCVATSISDIALWPTASTNTEGMTGFTLGSAIIVVACRTGGNTLPTSIPETDLEISTCFAQEGSLCCEVRRDM